VTDWLLSPYRLSAAASAIHLLFSANRWEAQSGMMAALKRGQHLVVDRYAYSGVAFSGSKVLPADALPLSLDWAAASDRGLPAPDVVLFLDISKEAAASRGGFGQERYETTEIQERVRQAFNQLRLQAEQPPAAADADGKQQQQAAFGAGVPWRVIDAGRSRDEVAADILRLAQETIERVARERAPIKFL
jgi:dTMP kinase